MNLDRHLDIYKEFLLSEKNLSKNTINNYFVDLKQFLIFNASYLRAAKLSFLKSL